MVHWPPDVDPDPGPDAGPLRGRRVGIRYDSTWQCFHWVRDEWERALRERGAGVQGWCAGDRRGDAGALTRTQLERFAEEVDVAIVGLGN